MRGKDGGRLQDKTFRRITPAYAGKRLFFYVFESQCLDHPRLCGEKQEFRAHVALPVGSPPPMRGKGLPVP